MTTQNNWITITNLVKAKVMTVDNVNNRFNESKLLANMKSQQSLSDWQPELCIKMLQLPAVDNYLAIKKLIKYANKEWIVGFLERGGLDTLMNNLNKTAGKSLKDTVAQLQCVECLRAVVGSRTGLQYISTHLEYSSYLASVLICNNTTVKLQVYELLCALCVFSADGMIFVREVLSHIKIKRALRHIYEIVVVELQLADTFTYQTTLLAFINCLILVEQNLKRRIYIRNELLALGLRTAIGNMTHYDDDALQIQITVFEEHQLADESLAPQKSHQELLRELRSKISNTLYDSYLQNILLVMSEMDYNDTRINEIWNLINEVVCYDQKSILDMYEKMSKTHSIGSQTNEKRLNKHLSSHIRRHSLDISKDKRPNNIKTKRSTIPSFKILYGLEENKNSNVQHKKKLTQCSVFTQTEDRMNYCFHDKSTEVNSNTELNNNRLNWSDVSYIKSSSIKTLESCKNLPPPLKFPSQSIIPPPPPFPCQSEILSLQSHLFQLKIQLSPPIPSQSEIPLPPPFPSQSEIPPPPPFPSQSENPLPSPFPSKSESPPFSPPPSFITPESEIHTPPPLPFLTSIPPPPPPPPLPFVASIPPPPPPPPPPHPFTTTNPAPFLSQSIVPPPPPLPLQSAIPFPPPLPSHSKIPSSPPVSSVLEIPPPPPLSSISPSSLPCMATSNNILDIRKMPFGISNIIDGRQTMPVMRKPNNTNANNIYKTLPPKNKLKTLNWTKINKKNFESSIWSSADLPNLTINFDEINELFCQKPRMKSSPLVSNPKNVSKVNIIHILDNKRSLAINIMLKQFKTGSSEILDALQNGTSIPLEKLKCLQRVSPTDEEIKMIKEQSNDLVSLGTAESFCLHLNNIANYKLKIELMIQKEELPGTVLEIHSQLDKIKEMCHNLINDRPFKQFLSLVLLIGNYLNTGSYAGKANGFTLDTLPKLLDTRANKPRVTFLHFVVEMAQINASNNILCFTKYASTLMNLSRISFSTLKDEINVITKQIRSLNAELMKNKKEPIYTQFSDFMNQAIEDVNKINQECKKTTEIIERVAIHFCEEINKFQIEDCFSLLGNFFERIDVVAKENINRRKLEERNQADKLKNEQNNLSPNKRNRTRALPKDEEKCIVDLMLQDIRKGSFNLRSIKSHEEKQI